MKYKILIILSMLVVLVFLFGITYSFFNSTSSLTSTDQDIAKFVFNAEKLDQIQLALIDLKPGDNREYLFSITNKDEDLLSDITIEYQMTIKTYHLVPLMIELYFLNGEDEELILTCDETYTRNEQNELICSTPNQNMVYDTEKLDNYKLKVSFPAEHNGELYTDLVDYINIEIKSWQKTTE